MNMTAAHKTSSDYSSFWPLHRRASRVKSATSTTNPGDCAGPRGGGDSLGNNSFDYSDLRGSRLIAAAVEPRQVYCYEVMWNGFTTSPDDRRLT
jgi:hypothetical protein